MVAPYACAVANMMLSAIGRRRSTLIFAARMEMFDVSSTTEPCCIIADIVLVAQIVFLFLNHTK